MIKMQFFLLIILISLNSISAQTPGTLKWVFQTGGEVNSSAAIGTDGTVYFLSHDSLLYAVNPNGTKKWDFPVNIIYSNSYPTPAIASDGTIYIRSDDGKLYAVNPDGSMKWDFQGGGGSAASPAIASDGTVYYSSGKLYALNPDGSIKWESKVGDVIATPTIGADGTIYLCYGITLSAINPDGTLKWEARYEYEGFSGASPVIDYDGTIYISGYNDLYAINPDGTVKWKFYIPDYIESSPAIASDGTVYIGLWKSIYAINQDGTKKWEHETGGQVDSSPAIGSDGTIYIGSSDSLLYALNTDGTIKWTYKTNGRLESSPTIAPDGTVYFGSADSSLYAVYSGSLGLDDSPWPRYRKNNQNTANNYNENCPQAVVAESFFSVKEGGEVTLDGSGSYDPDGEPLSYLWRIAEKTQGAPDILLDSTSAIITVNIPQGLHATYRFALTVTDNDDGYSSASIEVSTQIKWEFQANRSFNSSPAIGQDGTVYVGSGSYYDNDRKISAINPDGTIKWEFNDVGGSPVIGSDSTIYTMAVDSIYWGSYFYNLYAINPNGQKKWEAQIGIGGYGSTPAIASDGTVYAGALYAINPDGSKGWYTSLGDEWWQFTSPVIAADGTIYVGTTSGWNNQDGKLFAVASDGTIKWAIETWGISRSPAIGADGTVYVVGNTSRQGAGDSWVGYFKFYAVKPDGTIKWEFETGGAGAPVIGSDGTLYIASDSLYTFNPDGSMKWSLNCGGSIPAIGSDGTIYSGSYAVNPNGTVMYNTPIAGEPSAIADDGTIYVVSDDGKLYALYSDSKGLADSPWPKYRHDNRNTGNTDTPVPITQNKIDIPKKYALFPMYPNPFNPVTHVKFSLPKPSKVEINVYNILGQKVAKLLNAKKTAGTYKVSWDASHFASGMYFIHFESGQFEKVRKCLFIK